MLSIEPGIYSSQVFDDDADVEEEQHRRESDWNYNYFCQMEDR